jgi:hypothetical protein
MDALVHGGTTASEPTAVAKSLADVPALTVRGVFPAGVAAVVVMVRVDVFELSAGANDTTFGLKVAAAPVGRVVVIERLAVKLPDEPPPEPRETVIV